MCFHFDKWKEVGAMEYADWSCLLRDGWILMGRIGTYQSGIS
jgi:hypothetical protein